MPPKHSPWLACLALALVLAVMLPFSPWFQPPPPSDAGVFLYMGEQILAGRLPYRDVFDHKPPVVYYLNALGLIFAPGSMWGVWVVETICVSLAALLAVRLLSRVWGAVPAVFGLTGGLLTLSSVLHGGHYPEDFALLFQAIALSNFERGERAGKWSRRGIWIGAAVGLAFFSKQTLVGVGAAIGLYLLLKVMIQRTWSRLFDLGWMGLGFGGVTAVILAYFYLRGGWADFWAAYQYNQAYASLGLLERSRALMDTLEYLFTVPGFGLAFIAWVAALGSFVLVGGRRLADWLRERSWGGYEAGLGILLLLVGLGGDLLSGGAVFELGLAQWGAISLGGVLLILGWLHGRGVLARRVAGRLEAHRIKMPLEKQALLGVAVICFPIELILISLSARNYVYYYILLIPVTLLLLAFLADYFMHHRAGEKGLAYAWLGALLVGVIAAPLLNLPSLYRSGVDRDLESAVAFIQSHTTPVDSVLTWGAAPTVNFYSGRPAPSKYVYKYPLYLTDAGSSDRTAGFLSDLTTNRPKYLVDTMNDDQPFIGKPGAADCVPAGKAIPDGLKDVFAYLCQNYRLVEQTQPGGWRIFEIIGTKP